MIRVRIRIQIRVGIRVREWGPFWLWPMSYIRVNAALLHFLG